MECEAGYETARDVVRRFERSFIAVDDAGCVMDCDDGAAYAANVEWYATPLTTVSFSARRDVEETGAAGAATYLSSDLGLRVDHELRRNIILSGGVGRVQQF